LSFNLFKYKSGFLLAFSVLILPGFGLSQSNLLQGGGAIFASRAGTISILQGGDAIYGNVAGMCFGKKEWMVDAGAEIKFGHQELGTYSLAFTKTSELNGLGIKLIQYGNTDYLERKISISYSRLLFPKVSIGTSINYNTIAIKEYGTTSTPTVDFGIYTSLNKYLDFGATVHQISTITNQTAKYPSILALGLRYSPSSKVVVGLEAFKVLDRPLTAKTSLKYSPSIDLHLMGGVDIVNQIISFGFAYGAGGVGIAGGYSNSPLLPSTPAFNVRYNR
jgi:hypothetical protein